MRKNLPAIRLFGVRIHAVTMHDTIAVVDEAIRSREQLQIGVVNAAKVVNMQRDPALGEDVRSSDLILADGMAIVWASKLFRCGLPERVTGIDLMTEMLRLSNNHGYSIYCLGATEEVSAAVAERIAREYPNARLAGRRDGYFKPDQEEQVAADIAASRADILLVAMTSPKKEQFLARYSAKMGVPVTHGVGGSFDVFSGKVARAPLVLQKTGLEWLYRVMQEPRRLWKRYLVTNLLFCRMVFAQLFMRPAPIERSSRKAT
jgi:N-acetylglucosaminyldiphosphoundecaprenol N-acetyl-beta-D-mannosaminyltransferase